MARKEAAELNKFYFNYVYSHGAKSDYSLAASINARRQNVSSLRRGLHLISAPLLLKTLQEYPPKTWEEFGELGRVWLLKQSVKRTTLSKEISKRSNIGPVVEVNQPFFDLMWSANITIDAEIARVLGVSREYISRLRRGKNVASPRIMKLAQLKAMEHEQR